MNCNHHLYISPLLVVCDKCNEEKVAKEYKKQLHKEYHLLKNQDILKNDLTKYFKKLPEWMIKKLVLISSHDIELDKRRYFQSKSNLEANYGHRVWEYKIEIMQRSFQIKNYSNKYWQNLIFNILKEKFIKEVKEKEIPLIDFRLFHSSWKNRDIKYVNITSPYEYYINGYDWDFDTTKYEDRRRSQYDQMKTPSLNRRNSI